MMIIIVKIIYKKVKPMHVRSKLLKKKDNGLNEIVHLVEFAKTRGAILKGDGHGACRRI